MRRLDDKYFMIKLSDQFFNLFLKVKADLDKKWNLIIDSVQFQELEQKGLMNKERLKKYENLDTLSGVKLNMQTEKQDLLDKIAELEKQLDQLDDEK